MDESVIAGVYLRGRVMRGEFEFGINKFYGDIGGMGLRGLMDLFGYGGMGWRRNVQVFEFWESYVWNSRVSAGYAGNGKVPKAWNLKFLKPEAWNCNLLEYRAWNLELLELKA